MSLPFDIQISDTISLQAGVPYKKEGSTVFFQIINSTAPVTVTLYSKTGALMGTLRNIDAGIGSVGDPEQPIGRFEIVSDIDQDIKYGISTRPIVANISSNQITNTPDVNVATYPYRLAANTDEAGFLTGGSTIGVGQFFANGIFNPAASGKTVFIDRLWFMADQSLSLNIGPYTVAAAAYASSQGYFKELANGRTAATRSNPSTSGGGVSIIIAEFMTNLTWPANTPFEIKFESPVVLATGEHWAIGNAAGAGAATVTKFFIEFRERAI